MEVTKIAAGLWRWTAWHEEWKDEVGCVYYEGADGPVLVDPLVPPEDEARFWKALDRDVSRAGTPPHVLVTLHYHARSAGALAARYPGARVWAPRRGRAAVERRDVRVTDPFRPGEPLPGGVEGYATARSSEVVFWIPEHRAVVPGDVLLGDDGGLRTCPDSWLPDGTDGAALRESLRPLLDLPVERVLLSHGDPVLSGGGPALARALAA